jgi:tetratricopeptide (TPR) repeat protein
LGLLAKALNRRRKLVEAERVYLQALEIEPENLELLTGLAVVYGNQSELDKAVSWYEKIFEIEKGYPWAVHAYVHILKSQGKEDQVGPILDDALQANPDSALINILYGVQQRETGNQSIGETHIEKGVALLDSVDCEEQTRALRLLLPDDTKLTLELATRLLQNDPDNIELQLLVATARSRYDPETAAMEVKKIVDFDPNNPRVLGSAVGIMMQKGDLQSMMEYKERLEKAAPDDDLNAAMDMILARQRPGEILESEEAQLKFVETTRRVLKRTPVDPMVNLTHLHALIMSNQFEESREHAIKMANEIEFNNIKDQLFFAYTIRRLGLDDEARAVYKEAENNVDTEFERLLVHLLEQFENEDYSEIEKICSMFIAESQAPATLYSILGRVQHYTGHKDAKLNLQIAADMGDHNAMILLASLLGREGEDQKASHLLQQVASSEEIDSITRARALAGLKQYDDAANILEKLLREQPGKNLAWYLLTMIKRQEGPESMKKVLKAMLESGIQDAEVSDIEKLHQGLERDKTVDELANAVMIGDLGAKIKHQLLEDQVISLVFSGQKGEIK